MKYFINCLVILTLGCNNLSAQSGWYLQQSGVTYNLEDVQFLSENVGFAVGGLVAGNSIGVILKTTNGGTNWNQSLFISGSWMRGLHFMDFNTGTVVGSGPFKRTTTGGVSWFNQTNPYIPSAWKVHFINSNTGMAVGSANMSNNGGVIYTTDGGTTWADRSYGHDYAHWDVQLLEANTAFVVNNFSIIKTTNAGVTWIQREYPVGYGGVSFLDFNKGIVCGGCWPGRVKITTNGGDNWTAIFNPAFTGCLLDIQYIDNDNMVTVGDTGKVYRSTNGGATWFPQPTGTTNHLNAVWFINPNTGWAVGNNGVILKTTTGGFTAVRPISNEIPSEFELYQNYPNPFNSKTIINFQLSMFNYIQLVVYDVLGRQVETLVNEELQPGTYEVDFDGTNYPSGVYYYRLIAGDYTETRKFVLTK
jgi:photosystem II stability/assembly factor-like uncharacterized protein